MRRIGLLGGTFDPPHVGHLVVAECARVDLGLEEVRLLVAGDPWMKSTVSAARDRVELAQTAVHGETGLVVDARETDRHGPTYTAETLEELTREEPDVEWYFLLGRDAARALPRWGRGEDALALARFVVLSRPGYDLDDTSGMVRSLRHLDVPALEVSSTDLRRRYRQGAATRFQVPPAVDDLVRERRLYREG